MMRDCAGRQSTLPTRAHRFAIAAPPAGHAQQMSEVVDHDYVRPMAIEQRGVGCRQNGRRGARRPGLRKLRAGSMIR